MFAKAYNRISMEVKKIDNIQYICKKELYYLVDTILDAFNFEQCKVRIMDRIISDNAKDFITIERIKGDSNIFCGMLCKSDYPKGSLIIINSNKQVESQRFALLHEYIHYFLHPANREYLCNDKKSKDILEWQANEGAAELALPHKLFISRFIKIYNKEFYHYSLNQSPLEKSGLYEDLGKLFLVSKEVIRHRVKNLKYEIAQYLNGVNINNLEILSNLELAEKDIILYDFEEFHMKKFNIKSSDFSSTEAILKNNIFISTPNYFYDV